MDRIQRKFSELKNRDETAFIPFSVAGYPDVDRSMDVFLKIAEAGGDILEFGYPFSDPVADGPVIQKASSIAIRNGMTMGTALNMVAGIRERSDIPIVFFSYFNPIHKYGTKKFCERAKECGVDGLLIVDLPLEETLWLKPHADAADLAWIFLATPTTPPERIQAMDRQGTGFLYYVSVTGVTGARQSLPQDLADTCGEIRSTCRLPLAVGFGVSDASQAAWLRPHVDGVVIGSAILSRLEKGDSVDELGLWVTEIETALRQK
jgi:tryptophan synthase alpha chain